MWVKKIELRPSTKDHRVRPQDVAVYYLATSSETELSWKKADGIIVEKDKESGAIVARLKEPIEARYLKVSSIWDDRDIENHSIVDYSTFKNSMSELLRVWTLAEASAESYDYDSIGNRRSLESDGISVNCEYYKNSLGGNTSRILHDGTWYYRYDAAGNRIQKGTSATGIGDNMGIDASGERWDYTWDLHNRLVKVESNTGVSVSYVYNALNQRVKRTGKNGTTIYAYGRNGALTYEKNLATGVERSYAYLNDTMIGWTETKNGYSVRYFAVTDNLGSVTQIRDEANKVLWDGEYMPFGSLTASLGSLNYEGMFTGKDIDPETGLTYHWNRWRSEDGSYFISEDPARDGLSWYVYVANNPLRFIDPTGLEIAGVPSFWTMNQKGAYWANDKINLDNSTTFMSLEGCGIAAMENVLTQIMSITHGVWSPVTPGMINYNPSNFSTTKLDSIVWNETASQYGAKATVYDKNPIDAIYDAHIAVTSQYVIVQIPITVKGIAIMHYVVVNGVIQKASNNEVVMEISATSVNDTIGSRRSDISSDKALVINNGKLCVKLSAITKAIIVTRGTYEKQESFTDNVNAFNGEIIENQERAILASTLNGTGGNGSTPDYVSQLTSPYAGFTINR